MVETAMYYDTPGLKLRQTLRNHRDTVICVAWAPNGKIIASSSSDKTIRIWDVATGQQRYRLTGHNAPVRSVAWSPDGKLLASGSDDQTVRVWDTRTWQRLSTLSAHSSVVHSVAWSPDGRTLASGSWDTTIRLWNVKTGTLQHTLTGHSGIIYSVAWLPTGQGLISGADDKTIRLWNAKTGKQHHVLKEHTGSVRSVAWSPDGKIIASGSDDKTVRLWNSATGQQTNVIEGHTGSVFGVSFSWDGHFLASKSKDGTVQIWRCDTCEIVAILPEVSHRSDVPAWLVMDPSACPSFHLNTSVLATLGESDATSIRIWQLDFPTLRATAPVVGAVHYANAKVVLMGDSGVGKSGLALVLNGEDFVATESTHGRHVWTLDRQKAELGEGRLGTRETLLWDMSGQPGYRLVHQLHLNEVAIALVVFDARSETDPFAGVRYWNRALSQMQRIQGKSSPALKKFLVSARADRGGIGVSKARIDALVRDLGFDGYFETSARENTGIAELKGAIQQAIRWELLPQVNSTNLFQRIKSFLLLEKQAGRLLSTIDDLYSTFYRSDPALFEIDDLRAQFETCIGRIESRDLIRRLSFGNLVLLQPELLDTYASALVNAAKSEPEGLGTISEEDARFGRFRIPENERIKDKEQEQLLLIATSEDLLYHEIALRENAEDGTQIIFPSELTRERPDSPDPEGKAVIFTFDGPVLNIYATLAVRISHSSIFKKQEMWKNAATYTAQVGGTCGMFLSEIEEGRGELTLFFDTDASEQTRFQFEEYIYTHLQRRANPDGIARRRIFTCPDCTTPVTELAAKRRRERNFNWIRCGVCDTRIELLDREERLTVIQPSLVPEMDRAADEQRERETAASIIQGKIATNDFDVFLCHNTEDKPLIRQVAAHLKMKGILPWLDEWELRPGLSWQHALERQIGRIKSVAVFVGREGIGPWQQQELEAFLREFVRRGCPVIPVILSYAPTQPRLPVFLRGMTWVDFRRQDPDPLEHLIWGITGERSGVRGLGD